MAFVNTLNDNKEELGYGYGEWFEKLSVLRAEISKVFYDVENGEQKLIPLFRQPEDKEEFFAYLDISKVKYGCKSQFIVNANLYVCFPLREQPEERILDFYRVCSECIIVIESINTPKYYCSETTFHYHEDDDLLVGMSKISEVKL